MHIAAAYRDEELTVTLRYLFIKKTIIPSEKKKKEEQKEESAKEKPKEKKEKTKRSLEEIIDGLIDAIERYKGGAKMILKNIRVHELVFFWRITAEDAAACAIKYGKACAGISTAFGFFRNLIKIEHVKMKVFPDYVSEKDEAYGSADMEASPLIVLIGALRIGIAFALGLMKKENNKTSAAEI